MGLLTVCIPTVPTRRSLLSRLMWHLTDQDVDVLIADGWGPMGDKLNAMFAKAATPYVVAVDDDDLVAKDYVEALRQGLETGADFIGHDILFTENGEFRAIVKHSLDGDPQWGSFERGVSPKCPVRADLARQVEFGNEYTADRLWSQTVHGLAKTGAYLPEALYHYDHWTDHMLGTSVDDGFADRPQRDVGDWPADWSSAQWL